MEPDTADYKVMKSRNIILNHDRHRLLLKAEAHTAASIIGVISSQSSWLKIWDEALNHGSKGTNTIQKIIRILAHPDSDNMHCFICGQLIETTFLTHCYSSCPIKSQSQT